MINSVKIQIVWAYKEVTLQFIISWSFWLELWFLFNTQGCDSEMKFELSLILQEDNSGWICGLSV